VLLVFDDKLDPPLSLLFKEDRGSFEEERCCCSLLDLPLRVILPPPRAVPNTPPPALVPLPPPPLVPRVVGLEFVLVVVGGGVRVAVVVDSLVVGVLSVLVDP